jgi:hypothetical protein
MFTKLLPLAIVAGASLTGFGASAQDPNLSQTCRYKDGARAGQVVDYSSAPGAPSVQVGSRCADMQGSSGSAIAQGAEPQRPGRFFTSPGAPRAWS